MDKKLWTNDPKPLIVVDVRNNVKMRFESIHASAKFFDMDRKSIREHLDRGSLYKKQYSFYSIKD